MEEIQKKFNESTDETEKAALFQAMVNILDAKKKAHLARVTKYRSTEKGKEAVKRANAKQWAKKRSGRPRGRPRKNTTPKKD